MHNYWFISSFDFSYSFTFVLLILVTVCSANLVVVNGLQFDKKLFYFKWVSYINVPNRTRRVCRHIRGRSASYGHLVNCRADTSAVVCYVLFAAILDSFFPIDSTRSTKCEALIWQVTDDKWQIWNYRWWNKMAAKTVRYGSVKK